MALRKAVQDDPLFLEDFEHAGRDWVPRLKPCGTCHFCERVIVAGLLFCGPECSTGFEHFERQLLRAH